MPDRSDSDSSPKSFSGDSSSGSEEVKPIRRAGGSRRFADPGSPSNAQQSSDEGGSSDGVLVDLPGNRDQDSRGSPGEPDSGILVNIDGSMQESTDDSGREDTFEDAPDQLSVAVARSLRLEESMAVIDVGESSTGRLGTNELTRFQARLEDVVAECQKYKDEREVFGKEVVSLWRRLQDIFDRHSLLAAAKNDESVSLPQLKTSGGEDRALSSPTPLHLMLNECSQFLVDLESTLDERINSDGIMRELRAVLNEKDQEIEDLNVKASESSVSHDVIFSYLGSLRKTWSKSMEDSTNLLTRRLLSSLESVVGEAHMSIKDSPTDDISLVEQKTLMLIEKHSQFLSEIHLLQQCLAEVGPAFTASEENELGNIFSFAREKLFESKTKEGYLQEEMNRLEEENRRVVEQLERMKESLEAAEVEKNKTKAELEQSENKLVATREKLSIAVTKGKSLVQHRDSLKQSLAEKTGELEKCMQELQQKSEALQATEVSLEELKELLYERTSELETCLEELQHKTDEFETAKVIIEDLNATNNLVSALQESLSQRDKFLQEIEEIMLATNSPQEVLSMETIDRVRWFVNQKNAADIIILENKKIRDAISSIELPEDVSPRELDYQINWLLTAFTHAKDDNSKLRDQISGFQLAMVSHETEMSEAHKEIACLESYLLEEKSAKEILHNEHEDLKCKYEEMVQKLSTLSSDKDQLMKVLLELSESTLDDHISVDTSSIAEKCMIMVSEKMKSSLAEIERYERMLSTLYLTAQELKLCEGILEDEMIDRSAMVKLSDELTKLSNEAFVLKNEKDSIQKQLDLVEEKNSLLREKLSMAVKKGKGLMQERDHLKLSVQEKEIEIENRTHELQLKDSTINEYQEKIKNLSAKVEHIEKLEADIVLLKDEREQSQQILHERGTILNNLVSSIGKIVVPSVEVLEGPLEKVNWIAEYIQQTEVAKSNALEELHKAKDEARLQASRLSDAFATIKSLEDELSKAEKHISFTVEEKNVIQLGKISIEHEFEKLKEESSSHARKLSEAYATIKSLEDALQEAEKDIVRLNTDMNELEAKSEQEIIDLNAKLIQCREELAGTREIIENHSAELNNQLGYLEMFIKDESLFSRMAEKFSKSIEGLRTMNNLIQNMHSHFSSVGLRVHPSMQHDPAFRELPSLPKFEDFMDSRAIQLEASAADNEDISSLAKIVGSLHARAELCGDNFEVFCKILDEHIAGILQAMQATRDEFVHVLEHSESLKLDVHKLEAHNKVQEAKLVSLQKGLMTLFPACIDAMRELNQFSDSSGTLSNLDKEAFSGGLEEKDTECYAKAADSLLLAAKRIKNQYQQSSNSEKVWLTATDDMKSKLEEAESIAKTAIQEQMIDQERISTLERDLEALRELCHDMKIKVENYQAKEDMLKDKEQELLTMQNALDREIGGLELFKSQMNALMDKVNKLEVHFIETETHNPEVQYSGPVEKLFFIVDKVIDMQKKMDILTYDKEDMQLMIASHVREIEYLKRSAETIDIKYQELESQKNELLEITGDLEKIVKRLGGYDPLQDQKPLSAKLLLAVLERLITASRLESENLKSKAQELGAKLQAKDNLIKELSEKVKILEDSIHTQQDVTKERTVFEETPTTLEPEISEIEDVGLLAKNISPVATAAQLRTMRKGSNDHLILNIDSGPVHSIAAQEIDAKGHVFKSLNTTGLIPKQGKLIADRIDGVWVSGGQLLMRRPGARLSIMAYMFFLHLWLLGTIL
ncbi:unnamed protein product [Musa acuminata var. zebrina]